MDPRSLTWLSAGAAARINWWAHHPSDPVLAWIYALSSIGGITVWEVSSYVRRRIALREADKLATRFGWRLWLSNPRQTHSAWKLDARSRVSERAKALLAQVERERAQSEAAESKRVRVMAEALDRRYRDEIPTRAQVKKDFNGQFGWNSNQYIDAARRQLAMMRAAAA